MDVRGRLQQIRGNKQMMTNPMVQNVFNLLDSRNSKGLVELFNNTCNTKGINPEEYLEKLKR